MLQSLSLIQVGDGRKLQEADVLRPLLLLHSVIKLTFFYRALPHAQPQKMVK